MVRKPRISIAEPLLSYVGGDLGEDAGPARLDGDES
jgi:hypothetical protein